MGYYAKKIKHEGGGVEDIYNNILRFFIFLFFILVIYILLSAKNKISDVAEKTSVLAQKTVHTINDEPVSHPVLKAVFYDAEEFDLPELPDDEPYNVESYLVDTLARPAQDLKKGVINFFKNKNNQISTVDE